MTLVLVVAAFLLIPATVRAYEEPPYDVVKRSEGFEVRRYPAHLVAETQVRGSFEGARNEAFRRLFRYISGSNRPRQSVAMTVPVTTTPAAEAGRKLEMTVPVTSSPSDEGGFVMRFFLPRAFTQESVPQPTDPAVRIDAVAERWVAVRTYSGRANEASYRKNERALLELLRPAGYGVTGRTELAVYNGPFTPWFLRRNEVWVEIAPVAPVAR